MAAPPRTEKLELRTEKLELRTEKLELRTERRGLGFNFENLLVYQKSRTLSIDLVKIAAKFPNIYHRLSDQLIGAVTSIALNIAEGSGRSTQKDRNQFYKIARTSAFEVIAILDICEGLKLLEKRDWVDRVEEICKMFSGLIKNI